MGTSFCYPSFMLVAAVYTKVPTCFSRMGPNLIRATAQSLFNASPYFLLLVYSYIPRILMPKGTAHSDHSDAKHLDAFLRPFQGLPPLLVDRMLIHNITAEFSFCFLTKYLLDGDWNPQDSLDKFMLDKVNVTHVKVWANERVDNQDGSTSSAVGWKLYGLYCSLLVALWSIAN